MSSLKKRKLRNTCDRKERSDEGRFVKSCACIMHRDWSNDDLYLYRV